MHGMRCVSGVCCIGRFCSESLESALKLAYSPEVDRHDCVAVAAPRAEFDERRRALRVSCWRFCCIGRPCAQRSPQRGSFENSPDRGRLGLGVGQSKLAIIGEDPFFPLVRPDPAGGVVDSHYMRLDTLVDPMLVEIDARRAVGLGSQGAKLDERHCSRRSATRVQTYHPLPRATARGFGQGGAANMSDGGG